MECSLLAGERVKSGIDVDQARRQPAGAKEVAERCALDRLARPVYRVHFTCALTCTVLVAGDITLETTKW
jgi:hypothetical protein